MLIGLEAAELAEPEGKIYRVDPKFARWPSSFTENPYSTVLELTQILGQPCEFQVTRAQRGGTQLRGSGDAAGAHRSAVLF